MMEELARLPGLLAAHVGLTLAALALGISVSIPLGIAVSRLRRLEPAVLGAASIIQIIPSLALLAFMVPALAAIGAPSIGYLPALAGLFLYSLLPVLRNTVTGISGIDPAVLEAARGVGMTPREQLLRVELPLALPVIIAGIRTVTVWTVGTATLATPVGARSLGDYIFGGLQTRNYTAVLVGCVASAVLALVLDGLVQMLGAGVTRHKRWLVVGSLAAFALLALIAIAPSVSAAFGDSRQPVAIGAKTFTEQYILSRIVAGRIHENTGLPTRTLDSLGSTVAFDALRTGQIDAYVEYSGTLWTAILGHGYTGAGREAVLRDVERELARRYRIPVAAALGFENTYALAMRRGEAERRGIRRISDLTVPAPSLRIAGDYEFFQRPEWRSIESTYRLAFQERRTMDPSLLYEAARAGQTDVISASSTDGRLVAYGLVILEDDRRAIPPYDALILVSERFAETYPAAVDALRRLNGAIDGEAMRQMNAAVDAGEASPQAVADRFLAASPR